MSESVFNKVAGPTLLKIDSNTGVICEICEIVKNTFFTEHLFTVTASVYSENLGKILARNN